jgi:hypothetical protein
MVNVLGVLKAHNLFIDKEIETIGKDFAIIQKRILENLIMEH